MITRLRQYRLGPPKELLMLHFLCAETGRRGDSTGSDHRRDSKLRERG